MFRVANWAKMITAIATIQVATIELVTANLPISNSGAALSDTPSCSAVSAACDGKIAQAKTASAISTDLPRRKEGWENMQVCKHANENPTYPKRTGHDGLALDPWVLAAL